MDKNSLIAKLNKTVPGAILESRRFGRSDLSSIWIEGQVIQKVAFALKSWVEVKIDWLENLSVVEFDKVLVITYFVRSTSTGDSLVIRASAVPESSESRVLFPSIRSIWPMGEPMEQEAEEMFGIQFRLNEEDGDLRKMNRLPEDWDGFPLRKSYLFPESFLGITHARTLDRTNPKKFSSS